MAGADAAALALQEIEKLTMMNFTVELPHERDLCHFVVDLDGPRDTPYYGWTWKIDVVIGPQFPTIARRVKFLTSIYHPNISVNGKIHEALLHDMVFVFSTLLPNLLRNPDLVHGEYNSDAKKMRVNHPNKYKLEVREHSQKNALSRFG